MRAEIDYADQDNHSITASADGVYVSISFTKRELDQFIQTLIKYTQSNPEWKQ